MKASTELFLWKLRHFAGELYRPSYRSISDSFEAWTFRSGLVRHIQRLEAEAYMEKLPGGSADRVYRLTAKGRRASLGGKDPEEYWKRPWDGKWRLLMFDLPQSPRKPRHRLYQFLKANGLGCIQGSVWLSPDPLETLKKHLKGDRHPSSLLLFEGTTIGGETAGEMVLEAWNFDAIKIAWLEFHNRLERGKKFLNQDSIAPGAFESWAMSEHNAWKEILKADPLLPAKLLPRAYPGRKLWRQRNTLWQKLSDHIQAIGYRKNCVNFSSS